MALGALGATGAQGTPSAPWGPGRLVALVIQRPPASLGSPGAQVTHTAPGPGGPSYFRAPMSPGPPEAQGTLTALGAPWFPGKLAALVVPLGALGPPEAQGVSEYVCVYVYVCLYVSVCLGVGGVTYRTATAPRSTGVTESPGCPQGPQGQWVLLCSWGR